MSRILKIMGLQSAALFIALVVLAKFMIEPEGFTIFDSHFGGYSVAEARDFLTALSEKQTQTYLGLFRTLDTVFPVLLALTLAGVIWTQARAMHVAVRAVIALSPCVYLGLDLAENASIALLLVTGPQVSAGAILQASAYTVAKWISLTLAMLLAVWAWRLAPKDGPTA